MYKWVVARSSREIPATIVLGALFWSGVVGLVCAVVVGGSLRQIETARWAVTEGTVTVSEPTGRKHNFWNLEYQYAVAGQSYTSTRYAYDPMPIQGHEEVRYHMAAHPVGSKVAVSYNGADPAESVIHPGLRGSTLWVALVLTPFVIVGLGLWIGVLRHYLPRPGFDPHNPRQVATADSGALVVRPEVRWWLPIFLTYLGFAAFVTMWALGMIGEVLGVAYWFIDGSALDPSPEVPVMVWAALLVGCARATWWTVRRAAVLTIGAQGQGLRLVRGGSEVEVPAAAILGVAATATGPKDRDGRFEKHRVEIYRAGAAKALVVAEYDDPRDADSLLAFLLDRFRVLGLSKAVDASASRGA